MELNNYEFNENEDDLLVNDEIEQQLTNDEMEEIQRQLQQSRMENLTMNA